MGLAPGGTTSTGPTGALARPGLGRPGRQPGGKAAVGHSHPAPGLSHHPVHLLGHPSRQRLVPAEVTGRSPGSQGRRAWRQDLHCRRQGLEGHHHRLPRPGIAAGIGREDLQRRAAALGLAAPQARSYPVEFDRPPSPPPPGWPGPPPPAPHGCTPAATTGQSGYQATSIRIGSTQLTRVAGSSSAAPATDEGSPAGRWSQRGTGQLARRAIGQRSWLVRQPQRGVPLPGGCSPAVHQHVQPATTKMAVPASQPFPPGAGHRQAEVRRLGPSRVRNARAPPAPFPAPGSVRPAGGRRPA